MTQQRTIIEFHILQTIPPANLNRDDTGSPKTAIYGGVLRARVSSQAWKRPTRELFRQTIDQASLGLRTKRVVEVLVQRITDRRDDIANENALRLAKLTLTTAGLKLIAPKASKDSDSESIDETKYLLFMGNGQYDALADLVIDAYDNGDAESTIKTQKKQIRSIVLNDHSIDVALFGRMVADSTDLNIDAAAQVAHAISVQRVSTESDYYTAVDDVKQDNEDEIDSGAAMIGEIEFNSATFYRYANVDVNRLFDTLGSVSATKAAVEAFVRSFITSIPSGKINTFAHRTLPDLVLINVRDTQAVNLVGAFEEPIDRDIVRQATHALVERGRQIDKAYGTTPIQSWTIRVGDDTAEVDDITPATSLADAVESVGRTVAERLNEE